MIHTISLFKRLSMEEYKLIDKILPRFSKGFLDRTPYYGNADGRNVYRKYVFEHFVGLEGIRMALTRRRIYFNGFADTKSYLHITINPKVILNKDYISVANQYETGYALSQVDNLFKSMGITLTCADFTVSRVDCCFNFRFSDQNGMPSDEMAMDYLKLLKMGKSPKGFDLGMKYSESGRRFVPYENAIVYTRRFGKKRKKSIVINIYNKCDEIRKKLAKRPSHHYEQYKDGGVTLDNACGIVRFEVQLYYPKLYNIARSRGWAIGTIAIDNFISDCFTLDMLIYYLMKISFRGGFFTLETARRLVNEICTNVHEKTKKGLLTLLTQVSRQRGWKFAADNIYKEFPINSVKYLLVCLDRIGVSPVTIPKGWRSCYYPSPVNLLLNSVLANAAPLPYEVVPVISYDI